MSGPKLTMISGNAEDDSEPVEVLNEDALWRRLNTVTNHIHTRVTMKDGEYEVEVFFRNSNRSSVFARGVDTDRLHAMTKCLTEISRLW